MYQLPEWANFILLLVAAFNLALALVVTLVLGISNRQITRLIDVPLPTLDRWPSVSLIAAARNEERNIERAVRSLVTLDYPDLEITIVNDRSTDATGGILARLAAEFPLFNVVTLSELPAGWLGKNHALQIGANRSRGEWLLFTDADIVFEPTALKRAIAYANQHAVDHLVATPDAHMPSWFLKSFVVTFAVYFSLFVRIWSVRDPRSTAHVGVGAFNLVRAAVYRSLGSHERIRMRPDDDLKLGKIIKLAGFRQDVVHGAGLIGVEWYASLSELIRGLEKNSFSALEYNPWLTAATTLPPLIFNVWPYVAVFVTRGPVQWLYIAVCLVLWFMAWLAARGMSVPPSAALGFPLAVALMMYIQWRSMLLNYYHGGIRWRDTHYRLAELRANRV